MTDSEEEAWARDLLASRPKSLAQAVMHDYARNVLGLPKTRNQIRREREWLREQMWRWHVYHEGKS